MLFREHGYEHSRISQIIAAGAVNGSLTVRVVQILRKEESATGPLDRRERSRRYGK